MPDMSRRLLTAAVLTGLFIALAGHAAVPDRVPAHRDAIRLAAGEVSLDAAIDRVRETYGDVTILKAETRGRERRVHRIKFLTESGRVKTVEVDARTGDFR
jgi:hypothetical protein